MEKNLYVRRNSSRLVSGLILILIGIFLVGINVGLVPGNINEVIFTWPTFVIILGIIGLFNKNILFGLMLSFTGLFFLLPHLAQVMPDTFYWVGENFVSTFWPVLLILLGIVLIIYWLKPSKEYVLYRQWEKKKTYKQKKNHAFSRSAIFGSGKEIVPDGEFKGGEATAVFGGITLDLRKTSLPEGETHLEVSAVFGKFLVLVPETWYVESHLDSVFGDFQDNRISNENIDKSRKLIIEGECVFGGGELKN